MKLIKYDRACRALAEARSVDEVKNVRSIALAMKLYAKQAKNRELEADCISLRLRAERQLGLMLQKQASTIGLNRGEAGRFGPGGSRAGPAQAKPTLKQAGISKGLADRARKFSRMSEPEFDTLVTRTRNAALKGFEKPVIRVAKAVEARQRQAKVEMGEAVADLRALVRSGKKFKTILADPPWDHGGTTEVKNHYATMTVEQICKLPVGELAAKDSCLFLWGVWVEIDRALEVIEAWNFRFITVAFVWIKSTPNSTRIEMDGRGLHIGMGQWTRANTEFCLLAKRGRPERLSANISQVVIDKVREHSRKPAEVHDRIERLVGGPRLELFARRARPGWHVWGNQVARISSGPVEPVAPMLVAAE